MKNLQKIPAKTKLERALRRLGRSKLQIKWALEDYKRGGGRWQEWVF